MSQAPPIVRYRPGSVLGDWELAVEDRPLAQYATLDEAFEFEPSAVALAGDVRRWREDQDRRWGRRVVGREDWWGR